MEPRPEHLDQLAGLFNTAKTTAEREILLQGVRIISAKDCEALEEMLLRTQVRERQLSHVIALIAEQNNISNERAEEMVRDMIFDNLLDRTKLKLDGSVAPAQENADTNPIPNVEVPGASSDPQVAAPEKVKAPHATLPSSTQKLRPAVVIVKATEAPHEYPPTDLEQRGHQAGRAKGDARQLTEHGGGSPLMPKGVG